MFAYFLDDNVYNREGDAFWVRGDAVADILLRAPIDIETTAAVPSNRSLRIASLEVHLETGPKPNRVTVSTRRRVARARHACQLAADRS